MRCATARSARSPTPSACGKTSDGHLQFRALHAGGADLPRVHRAPVPRLRAQRAAPAAVERAVLRIPHPQQRAAVLRPDRVHRARPAPVATGRRAGRTLVSALRFSVRIGLAMVEFLSGAVTLGFLVAAGFFFRFWRKTADRLFLAFAAAFVLFALNQGLAAGLTVVLEPASLIYGLRVLGFIIILAAIVDKNATSGASRASGAPRK